MDFKLIFLYFPKEAQKKNVINKLYMRYCTYVTNVFREFFNGSFMIMLKGFFNLIN